MQWSPVSELSSHTHILVVPIISFGGREGGKEGEREGGREGTN